MDKAELSRTIETHTKRICALTGSDDEMRSILREHDRILAHVTVVLYSGAVRRTLHEFYVKMMDMIDQRAHCDKS